jgi:hypothetical protein
VIDGETGTHVWADRFETDRRNLAEAQSQITGRLAQTLQKGRQLQAELPVQFCSSRQTQIPLYSGFLAPTFAKHAFSQDTGSTGQLPSHRIS